MKTLKTIAFITLTVILFSACNKTKQYSKRLSGEKWKVTELSVDGVNEAELPTFSFNECDIYSESSCKAEWTNEEGGHSEFIWQFREKGKKFEISNQGSLEDSHGDHAAEEAILQCQNFSGVYDVKEHKKSTMEFETTSALGFSGKTVKLKMKKQ